MNYFHRSVYAVKIYNSSHMQHMLRMSCCPVIFCICVCFTETLVLWLLNTSYEFSSNPPAHENFRLKCCLKDGIMILTFSSYFSAAEQSVVEHLRKEELINCTCGFMEEDGLMIQVVYYKWHSANIRVSIVIVDLSCIAVG
jgi:hypothetical protein